jgi:hypothetical protein
MGLAGWVELITLILKFPSAILEVARLFQKTPAEKHDALLVDIKKQADQFANTGRPG